MKNKVISANSSIDKWCL